MLYLKLRKGKGSRPPLFIPLTGLQSLISQYFFYNFMIFMLYRGFTFSLFNLLIFSTSLRYISLPFSCVFR
jgi:hypothetical protein